MNKKSKRATLKYGAPSPPLWRCPVGVLSESLLFPPCPLCSLGEPLFFLLSPAGLKSGVPTHLLTNLFFYVRYEVVDLFLKKASENQFVGFVFRDYVSKCGAPI